MKLCSATGLSYPVKRMGTDIVANEWSVKIVIGMRI